MIDKDIDYELFIRLLQKTCGFEVYKDFVNGPIIEMDTWEAYHYARTFEAYKSQTYTFQYSEQENKYMIYRFPPTDTKLNLEYQTHLDFKNAEFFKPSKKYIIPYEVNKSVNQVYTDTRYNDIAVDQIIQSKLKPQNCLITEIYLKTMGNSLENFLEYLACKIFIERDYLVENQIFFNDLNLKFDIDIKIPDFGAYRIPELQNKLIDYGFCDKGGFLYDLSFLRLRGRRKHIKHIKEEKDDFIVGEAKSASAGYNSYIQQVEHYYKRGFFHNFLQITPKNPRIKTWYGYLDFNESGEISYMIPDEKRSIHKLEEINNLKKGIIQKTKYYLLQNLYFSELLDILPEKPKTFFDLNRLINNTKLEKILDFLDGIF